MVIAYPLPLFHSQSTSSRYNPASVVETSLKSYAFSVQYDYILLTLNKLQAQHLKRAIERVLTIVIPSHQISSIKDLKLMIKRVQ